MLRNVAQRSMKEVTPSYMFPLRKRYGIQKREDPLRTLSLYLVYLSYSEPLRGFGKDKKTKDKSKKTKEHFENSSFSLSVMCISRY